jgi:hypothetical protein
METHYWAVVGNLNFFLLNSIRGKEIKEKIRKLDMHTAQRILPAESQSLMYLVLETATTALTVTFARPAIL